MHFQKMPPPVPLHTSGCATDAQTSGKFAASHRRASMWTFASDFTVPFAEALSPDRIARHQAQRLIQRERVGLEDLEMVFSLSALER